MPFKKVNVSALIKERLDADAELKELWDNNQISSQNNVINHNKLKLLLFIKKCSKTIKDISLSIIEKKA